jgi:hypothetical protein
MRIRSAFPDLLHTKTNSDAQTARHNEATRLTIPTLGTSLKGNWREQDDIIPCSWEQSRIPAFYAAWRWHVVECGGKNIQVVWRLISSSVTQVSAAVIAGGFCVGVCQKRSASWHSFRGKRSCRICWGQQHVISGPNKDWSSWEPEEHKMLRQVFLTEGSDVG